MAEATAKTSQRSPLGDCKSHAAGAKRLRRAAAVFSRMLEKRSFQEELAEE